jgi:hypothetical protein
LGGSSSLYSAQSVDKQLPFGLVARMSTPLDIVAHPCSAAAANVDQSDMTTRTMRVTGDRGIAVMETKAIWSSM